MWRFIGLALLGLTCGCRAPMPTMDTISPFNATRVPPPGTGSYGTSAQDQYYPGAAPQAPAGPLPGVSVGVRPASAIEPIEPVAVPDSRSGASNSNEPAVRIVEQRTDASTTSQPRLRGMTVHDATREPGQFVPDGKMIEISSLPPASVPQDPIGRPAAVSGGAPATGTTLQWQTRPGA
ncbi:MAG: hypothetical protein J5I93_11935 [Pirellulaceae bacterium]|nr:hypothetical protein [Pirellulaceae bacterium]